LIIKLLATNINERDCVFGERLPLKNSINEVFAHHILLIGKRKTLL
jgi:hypothetical protein